MESSASWTPLAPSRSVDGDVFEEHFPLDLEGVVEIELVWDFGPVRVVVDGRIDVGIPDRAWGYGLVLCPAFAEADDGGALGAIDLHGEQVVAADADVP